MTVNELIKKLKKFDKKQEIIFYNLENYDLQNRELETIIEADGRVELTIKEFEG